MIVQLTPEERHLILQLLDQVNVKVTQQDAQATVALCQGLIAKLAEKENGE